MWDMKQKFVNYTENNAIPDKSAIEAVQQEARNLIY